MTPLVPCWLRYAESESRDGRGVSSLFTNSLSMARSSVHTDTGSRCGSKKATRRFRSQSYSREDSRSLTKAINDEYPGLLAE